MKENNKIINILTIITIILGTINPIIFCNKTIAYTEEEVIPSKYDLRNDIDITVKNQYQNGICYMVSDSSMWESHVKLKQKNGEYSFFTKTPVFSMLNMKNDIYIPISIDDTKSVIQNYYNDSTYTEDDVLKNVSNFQIGDLRDKLKLLTQNLQVKTIGNANGISQTTIKKEYEDNGTVIYKDAKNNILTYEEVEIIRDTYKKFILENGGLRASINTAGFYDSNISSDGIYNGELTSGNKVCFNNTSDGPNHAVLIIGWDDNFSKDNFPEESRPSKDGAYLVLNSWGSKWGDNGVFYISYEDSWVERFLFGLENLEVYKDEKNPTINFDENDDKIKIVCTDDYGSGIDNNSLKYMWTAHNIKPDLEDENWVKFDNGIEIADIKEKYLWVMAKDKSGNQSILNNRHNSDDLVIEGINNFSENWTNTDIEINVMNSNLNFFNLSVWSNTLSEEELENMKSIDDSNMYAININKEGSHTIYFSSINEDGYEDGVHSFTTKIDKTNPTDPIIQINGLGKDKKYLKNTNILIESGKDTLSGVNKTEIQILDRDGNTVNVADKTNFKLSEIGTYTIKAITYDNANNCTENEVLIEIVNDEELNLVDLSLKLENELGKKYEENTWTNKNVYIEKVENEETTYSSTSDSAQIVSKTSDATAITESGVTKIIAKIDNENININKEYVIKIDKLAPKITTEIESIENTTEKVMLKISASDDLSGIKELTINGEKVLLLDDKFEYEVNENGEYTINAIDNVENKIIKKVSITQIKHTQDIDNNENNQNEGNNTSNSNTNIEQNIIPSEQNGNLADKILPQTGESKIIIILIFISYIIPSIYIYVKIKK